MSEDVKLTFSVKQLSLLIGVMVAVMGAATAAGGFLFAAKADVTDIKMAMADTGDAKLMAWRIQTLEVRTDNTETLVQKMDKNVTALLLRFRVVPEPEPQYLPLPAPPKE